MVAFFVGDLLNGLLSYCLVLFLPLYLFVILSLCSYVVLLAFCFSRRWFKILGIVAHQVLTICLLYCLAYSLYLFFDMVDLCFYLFLFPLLY